MRQSLLLLAFPLSCGGVALAQDVPSFGINSSWFQSQTSLNAEKDAWAAPECVDKDRWSADCKAAAAKPAAAAPLRFTPSIVLRRKLMRRFVEQAKAADPAQGEQLEIMLGGGTVIDTIAQRIAPFGLRTDDVADAMALYAMEAWEAVEGRTLPPSRARAEAVRRQFARAALATPALAGADDAARQELAETLLVQAALIGAGAEEARAKGGAQARAFAEGVRSSARTLVGMDVAAMALTDAGLTPRAGAAAAPASSAAPTPAAPRAAAPGGGENALTAALAAVPAGSRPQFVLLKGISGFAGWPPAMTYRVETHLLFANGWATLCADWDPGLYRPTPESLGRAHPDCELRRWRRTGNEVDMQDEKGAWDHAGTLDAIRAFKPGERVEVAFGNIGGMGFAGAPGAVSVNTVRGGDLRMTRAGEIAVGRWSSVVVSGSNVGGGSNRRNGPTIGRYRLDGHVIAIEDEAGEIRRGFIAGVPGSGVLQHIYLNGTQFWSNDD